MSPHDHRGEDARDGLKAWQGALALIVVGIGAQILGGIAAVVAMLVEALATGAPLTPSMTGADLSFAVVGTSLLVIGATMTGGSALTALAARVPVRRALGVRAAPWPAFVAAPFGILALGPTSDFLRRLMQEYAPSLTFNTLDQLDNIVHSAPVWVVAPLFALVPGIAEEVLFRGAFQRSIRTRWLAVILSGVLFAAYHTDPHHVAAVLPLGLYLAWLGDRTGSVLVPITAHVANNAAAVIATVYFGSDPETPAPSLGDDLWWVPAGWLVAGLTIAVVWWSTRPADLDASDASP